VLTEFQLALRREFARAVRYRQPIALLLVDLPPGPDALGRVRDAIRVCDSAAPGPGDRVAVILPETPLAGALVVATRVAGALGPAPANGAAQALGVAAYPSPAIADADALLRAAEKAMENARSSGGGIMTPLAR
jgi:GGDEF domain-containing protein